MNSHFSKSAIVAAIGITLATATAWGDSSSTQPAEQTYLSIVQTFADNVLQHGRDVYGEKHTPLFVDGINVDTREPVVWLLPEEQAKEWGMPREWVLSNLASQQNLFRVLVTLTEMTGDPRYRKAAADATRYMFEHYQHETGLLYWGGHCAIDLSTDQPVGEGRIQGYAGKHELKSNYPFYELMWEVNAEATNRLVDAFWSAHILNWENLDFNRHGDFASPRKEIWSFNYALTPAPFVGDGLTFINTGSDLYYSGSIMYLLSRFNTGLRWCKLLAQRYTEVCDPNTGLGADNFSTERTNRIQQQFGPEFGDRFTEATITSLYRSRYRRAAICRLKIYERLGAKGEEFYDFAVKDLTAYARHAYDKTDNSFWATLIDGTKLSPADRKRDGYVTTKWLEKHPAEPLNLWAYALAFKLSHSQNMLMWDMSRDIAAGLGLGKLGSANGEDRKLNLETTHADADTIFAILELHTATRDDSFLKLAIRIGDNLVTKQFHKGLFVTDENHINCKFDTVTPLALLYLHKSKTRWNVRFPVYAAGQSYFHAPYEGMGRTYDHIAIYGQLRDRSSGTPAAGQ